MVSDVQRAFVSCETVSYRNTIVSSIYEQIRWVFDLDRSSQVKEGRTIGRLSVRHRSRKRAKDAQRLDGAEHRHRPENFGTQASDHVTNEIYLLHRFHIIFLSHFLLAFLMKFM